MNDHDHLIRRIKALVHVRELLRQAGASEDQLERQAEDIRRLQGALAERVRRTLRESAGA